MTQDLNLRLKELNVVPPKVKISVRSDSDPHFSSIDAAAQGANQVSKEVLTQEEVTARIRALGLMIPDGYVRKTYALHEPRRGLYL
ncbi:MAG: hypothetical protein AABW48_03755 [Nanoarchaeota archaeon]